MEGWKCRLVFNAEIDILQRSHIACVRQLGNKYETYPFFLPILFGYNRGMMEKQRDRKKIKFHYGQYEENLNYIAVGWKKWEERVNENAGECFHLQIPYNRIRKDLRAQYDAELFFHMVDPMSYLQRTLIDWYGRGAQREAFAFYRTLRKQVDYLGLKNSISVRTFADWLKEENPMPLFNPQIELIDSRKRLNVAKWFLKKDFSSLATIELAISEEMDYASSPLASIDFHLYRNEFGVFVSKDLELYKWIATGAFRDQEEKIIPSKEKNKLASKRPKMGGGVQEIRANLLKGFVRLSGELSGELRLLLQVNGKALRKKKLLPHQRDERGRITFSFRKLTLSPTDRVEVILKPGNVKLNLSPKAQEFFSASS